MARTLVISFALSLAGGLLAAGPAAAATCEELQAELNAAEAGATVVLAEGSICAQPYELPSRPVTLTGAGAGATLDGQHAFRILEGTDVGATTIRNLTLSNGLAGDAEGFGLDDGGAIAVDGYSPITIEGVTFEGNRAEGSGGAVAIDSFASVLDDAGPGTVTIRDSVFGGVEAGNAAAAGGALAVSTDAPIEVADSIFSGNVAGRSEGGAMLLASEDETALTDNEIAGNSARERAGGAMVESCTATVAGNTFSGNTVTPSRNGGHVEGGGLWLAADVCTLSWPPGGEEPTFEIEQAGNEFAHNVLSAGSEGSGAGAGEHVESGSLSSTDDVYHANEVTGTGAEGEGGGLDLALDEGQDALLRNLVATANAMPFGEGGAVEFSAKEGTLHVAHATLAANDIGGGAVEGDREGAGIDGDSGTSLVLHNSIVHDNAGGAQISGFGPDDPGLRARSAATTDIRFTLACDGETPFAGEGNVCADPRLADAAGGEVHQTAASPTLERASAGLSAGLAADYEGEARGLDADRSGAAEPDMGADESPAEPLTAPGPAPAPGGRPALPAQPPAAGGVLGTRAHRCVSRRSFRIRLRNRRQAVRSATVIVNGKRRKVVRGRRLTSRVDLRGLPKGRFTVKIVLRLVNGKTISGKRRYHTCVPPRRGGIPRV